MEEDNDRWDEWCCNGTSRAIDDVIIDPWSDLTSAELNEQSRFHFITIRDLRVKARYGLNHRKVWEAKWRGAMDVIIDTVGDSHNIRLSTRL